MGWIDRLKYGIPGITLSTRCDAESLIAYLRARRTLPGNMFSVERPAGRVQIVFKRTHWLFKLKLVLWTSDGVWRGNGSLEANATRLYAAIGGNMDVGASYVPSVSLLRPVDFTRQCPDTLDGKDNFVPAILLSKAMKADWCAMTGSYLDAVVEVANQTLGSAFDLHPASQLHDPLVRIPPSNRWTLKEAEVYSECLDENATFRIASIAEIARSMSSSFASEEHGMHVIPGEGRTVNATSFRVRLGAEGVHLSAYAKAFNRVRFEVRYTRYPISSCGLTAADYSGRPDGAGEALRAVRANALRRLRRFFRGYQEHRLEREPSLLPLTRALAVAAHAAPRTPTALYRIVSLLTTHGGLSHSPDPDVQHVIERLIEAGILRPAGMTSRSERNYVLGPTYAAAFRSLRQLLPR